MIDFRLFHVTLLPFVSREFYVFLTFLLQCLVSNYFIIVFKGVLEISNWIFLLLYPIYFIPVQWYDISQVFRIILVLDNVALWYPCSSQIFIYGVTCTCLFTYPLKGKLFSTTLNFWRYSCRTNFYICCILLLGNVMCCLRDLKYTCALVVHLGFRCD